MRKYLLFICLIFVSCSQTYLEETQDVVSINTRVSYNTLDTGIFIEWDTQWDFARVEILRGSVANQLTVFKHNLAQNQWLDIENMPGQDYYYKVAAYNSKDRLIGESDILKGYRSYRPYNQIVTPNGLKTYLARYSDKIEIFWAGDAQDAFRIYRSIGSDGIKTKIAEVGFDSIEELKFSDLNVEQGISYFYKISSVGKEEDGKISEKVSTESIEGSSKIAPKGAKTTTIVGGITLSWDEDIKAEYYQIFRSKTETGEYQMIVPFVKDEQYTDKNIPVIAGADIDGVYTYPSYYYQIKSFSKGQESGFSDPVVGHAIDPKDLLPAPTSFDVAVDKSSYSSELNLYNLTFSWDAVGDSGVTYLLSKIDDKGVSHPIDSTTSLTYSIPNEAFGSQWEYIVQAINNNAGDLPGAISSKNYTSATPAPPIILTISTNARTYETNNVHTNAGYVEVNSHVYWGSDTSMTGTVKKEWHVTSKTGNIDLTWDKQVDTEFVNYYTIYRRKQGESDFTKIVENIETLTHSDKFFTPEEYQGSGTGDDFKYPLYEYQITATFGLDESGPSVIELGSAINPTDILPAPDYVSIPGHWADGTGFNSSWKEGINSPKGIEKIVGEGGANHMYLVWGDVLGVSTYRVRYAVGNDREEWWKPGDYNAPTGNDTRTYAKFNNETAETGLYVFKDWLSYQKNSASFDVGSINGNAGNQLGDVRGIWFDEPDSKPAHY